MSAAAEHLSCNSRAIRDASWWIAEEFVPSRADSRRCALSIGMLRPSARSLHVYVPGGSARRSATLPAPWCFSHVIARRRLCVSVSRPSVWNSGSRPDAASANLQRRKDCQTHARSARAPQQHHHERPSRRGAPAQAMHGAHGFRAAEMPSATPSPMSQAANCAPHCSAGAKRYVKSPNFRTEPAPPPRCRNNIP
jgi:hypothetical protein